MKTKIILIILSALSAGTVSVISKVKNKTKTINIALLKGPSGMGGAYLWSKSDAGETKDSYNITLDSRSNEVGDKLISGIYDIACLPANIAYSLHKRSGGMVKIAAVTTLGMLHIVSRKDTVSGIKELNGKTILSAGKGTVAEYALRHILEKNGVHAEIEFTTEHADTVRKALEGCFDTLLLPEPFASQLINENPDFSVCVDINEEWKREGGKVLTMGCIAVNSDFYRQNRSKVKTFVNEYRKSVDFINNNTVYGAKIIDYHRIMPAKVAEKAIPSCNIVCLTNHDMEAAMSLCEAFFSQNDRVDSDFYIHTDY